jgi:hypothetical protein
MSASDRFQPISAENIFPAADAPDLPDDPVDDPAGSIDYCLGLLGFGNNERARFITHVAVGSWWGLLSMTPSVIESRLNTLAKFPAGNGAHLNIPPPQVALLIALWYWTRDQLLLGIPEGAINAEYFTVGRAIESYNRNGRLLKEAE